MCIRPASCAAAAAQQRMGKKGKPREPRQHPSLEQLDDVETKAEGDSKFARALGSGDFHTRDQGLQALERYLSTLESIEERSLQKLWKGLMYCFWHSDKGPVQRDLAQRLAGILKLVQEPVRPPSTLRLPCYSFVIKFKAFFCS